MVTLHGFPFSNYYNVVKHVLMHKGIPFDEDLNYGSSEQYLDISPVGKIPGMTTADGGHLSESAVCCDYLEDAYPEPALYPVDPYQRGRVRQVMKVSELYLELQARRLIRYAFAGAEPPPELVADARQVMERGINAMNRLCSFDPFVLGAEETMADIYLRYVMVVVDMIGSGPMQWDVGAEMPGLKEWQARMADSDIARKVDADMRDNADPFFKYLKERFGV